jgi:hypothetical protein
MLELTLMSYVFGPDDPTRVRTGISPDAELDP